MVQTELPRAEFSKRGCLGTARKLNGLMRRVASDFALTLVDVDSCMPKTRGFFGDAVTLQR